VTGRLGEQLKHLKDRACVRLCNRCVLPEDFPGITFHTDGVCNYCREHVPLTYKGEKELERVLDSFRSRGTEYDCLVPISGGRDSAYVLHQMKRKYDMRVAAFHYDGGFSSESGRKNVQAITEALDVDLLTATSSGDFQRRRVRRNVDMYLGISLHKVLQGLCNLCRHGYRGGALKTCVELGIPLVVFGASSMEDALYKPHIRASFFRLPRWKKLQLALRRPVIAAEWYYVNQAMKREFPLVRSEFQNITVVEFFDYVPWDEATILDTIETGAAWQPPSADNTWRFDCKIHALVDYMTMGLYGFNEEHDLYSKQIREGQLTRDEALQRLDQYEAAYKQRGQVICEVFDLLELSEEQCEAIMELQTL